MKKFKNMSLRVTKTLEKLVSGRFTIKTLEEHLSKEFDSPIKLEEISRKDDELGDFNLIGNLDDGTVFCDFDIYYLKMRRKGLDGANIYITEVGYQFE